mmetsp:Transcript_11231/g.50969  ORF Transcript_11231/g.50969 Transcript_11231/m.50969 type:complete len:81 (-) Transcript_11231:789-1031(-)
MMDVSHLFPMELPRVATESRPRVRAQMKPQKVLRIRLYYPRLRVCSRLRVRFPPPPFTSWRDIELENFENYVGIWLYIVV